VKTPVFAGLMAASECAVLLAGCANPAPSSGAVAPASSAASTTASPSSRACAASELAVTLTHTGAVGGQAGGYLTFTNKGGGSCRLTGWPAVTGVSKAGTGGALARAQSTMFGAWQFTSPMPVIDLAPGQSAYAVVAADDNPVGKAASCPAPYVELRVAVPGSSAGATVSAWLPGADSYLPTCESVSGKPTDETSDIVPLTSLAH